MENIKDIVKEIQDNSELTRRALSLKRHKVYKDEGKQFLLEQIEREFSSDAIPEMRLAPINLLKKMINKRSQVYKVAPVRLSEQQNLVDYYVKDLSLNELMLKANRYFNLHANCAAYVRQWGSKIKLDIIPPFLYSVVPNAMDKTIIDMFIFSSFNESGRIIPGWDSQSATGVSRYERTPGYKTPGKDLVASNELSTEINENNYIFWSKDYHFTTDKDGNIIVLNPELGDEQFVNPIGICPVINIAKDRDNESWSMQGEDAIDGCIALMLGWTDLLTIAKHQGFSILTVVSDEEPKQLKIGVNKAVWLRRKEGQEAPSISYVTGNSPLAEYKDLLMDFLGMLLSSNDMPPNSVGGQGSSRTYTSGFHAMIENADILEAVEQDKPYMKNAELGIWKAIAGWHNYMYDTNQLDPEARSLGRFNDDFTVSIVYKDITPIESEAERMARIKEKRELGLISRFDAMKELHPDLTEEQVQIKIQEIDSEQKLLSNEISQMLSSSNESEESDESEEKGESDNGQS